MAGVLAFLAAPSAKATLLIGFVSNPSNPGYSASNASQITVTHLGGTFLIDVVATSDDPLVTDLGIRQIYWGAISSVLNSNLGNPTLDGDIYAQAMNPDLAANGGTDGDISDVNADARNDLGPVTNASVNNRSGGGGSHPWWVVAGGGPNAVDYGNASVVLGTFSVLVPANTPNGNFGEFLRFTPNLQVSAVGNYDSWTENGTLVGGKYSTIAGAHNVNVGVAESYLDPPDGTVTFELVPEPGSLVLLALGGVGWLACRRVVRRPLAASAASEG